MGNGYAITAVIGTRAVMETANDSFISSTFWTEKIGNVGAKTLEIMEKTRPGPTSQKWAVTSGVIRKFHRNCQYQ